MPNPARIFKAVLRAPVKLSMKGLKTGDHITRYRMYQQISDSLSVLPEKPEGVLVLSISRSERLCKTLNVKDPEIKEANFPEYNILDLPFSNNFFDYVVADEVIEHVEGDPQSAFDEVHRILKPKGVAVVTTCLIHPIHGEPKDFWRFTPDALELLCRKFSKIISIGYWGNRYVWLVDWLGLRYDPVPEAKWHPMHKIAVKNDKKWPVVTWVIAQK